MKGFEGHVEFLSVFSTPIPFSPIFDYIVSEYPVRFDPFIPTDPHKKSCEVHAGGIVIFTMTELQTTFRVALFSSPL